MTQECERRSSPTSQNARTEGTGWYLYAITEAFPGIDPKNLSGLPNGAGGPRPVELVVRKSIAALASPLVESRVRPQRSNLAAHHRLLKELMDAGVPFLPAAFGVVAPTRQKLEALLVSSRTDLENELKRLSGKVEMGLKVHWEVDNIFCYFVTQYPDLAQQRDRVMGQPGGASRDEMIELGKEFEGLLKHVRERHTASIKRALEASVVEFKESAPRDEKVVLKISCLISRDRQKEFEQAVLQAAAAFDDHYAFDYSGPWPPFSFVNVSLSGAGGAAEESD